MHRNSPPFRAEHIGSLKRPPQLLQKRAEYVAGGCTLEELRQLEDECIKQAIELQRSTGMTTLSDGELRRYVFGSVPEDIVAQQRHSISWIGRYFSKECSTVSAG